MMIEIKQKEFTDLLLPFNKKLNYYALKLTSDNYHEANDLLQISLLTAWKFFDKFEKETNFEAWMKTIIFHQFVNQYRKQKRQPYCVYYDTKKFFCIKDKEKNLQFHDQIIEDDYFSDEIQEALSQHTDDLKQILLLAHVEHYSDKEIGILLSIPEGTVKSKLCRIKNKLSIQLKNYGQKQGYKLNKNRRMPRLK